MPSDIFNIVLPTRSARAPLFVALDLNFSYSVGRSKSIYGRRETICILFEPGMREDDAEESLAPLFAKHGCSLVPSQCSNWRGSFVRPGRILESAEILVDCSRLVLSKRPSHDDAISAIGAHALALAEIFGRSRGAEASECVHPSLSGQAEAIAATLDRLMPIHAALEARREIEASLPDANASLITPNPRSRKNL